MPYILQQSLATCLLPCVARRSIPHVPHFASQANLSSGNFLQAPHLSRALIAGGGPPVEFGASLSDPHRNLRKRRPSKIPGANMDSLCQYFTMSALHLHDRTLDIRKRKLELFAKGFHVNPAFFRTALIYQKSFAVKGKALCA